MTVYLLTEIPFFEGQPQIIGCFDAYDKARNVADRKMEGIKPWQTFTIGHEWFNADYETVIKIEAVEVQ